MIYQFMKEHRFMFPVERMAKVLNVSRSGYYTWVKRPRSRRDRENARLDVVIKAVYVASKRRYGSVKITRELRNRGMKYGRTRIANRMRKMAIRSIVRKRFKATTDSKHSYPVAPNLLNRNFTVSSPDEVWVSDITYIRIKSGWSYLTVFIDLYSRMVTGWAVSTSLSHKMVLEAFFKTVKTEWAYHVDLQDIHHVKRETFEYLEIFYNRERLHATLGYQSPAEYEELEGKKCA